jgi:phi13 family phage major tail protein
MEADNNNVKRMIISGCDKKSIRDGLEIIYRYDEIFMTAGFHPDEADTVTDKDLEDLENVIKTNKKIIGVGEIGLDYYHNDDNRDKQIELFEKQLKLAEKYDLPVVIHSRDSIQEVYDILAKHKNRGVIHCFSGSLEMALYTQEFRTQILGETVDRNGALVEDATATVSPFALGFRIDGDDKNTKFWYYNVIASRPGLTGNTTEDTITPQTETMNITANQRPTDNKVRVSMTESATNTTAYGTFFDDVYEASI